MADRKRPGSSRSDAQADEVQPEFRPDAGSGDLGAEESAPDGLTPASGTGSAHDYPGRAEAGGPPEDEEPEEPVTDSPRPAGEQDAPAPERPPEGPGSTQDQPEGDRD